MNTNKEVKWRRFIVPKKVEQINYHLFIDTYKCLSGQRFWICRSQVQILAVPLFRHLITLSELVTRICSDQVSLSSIWGWLISTSFGWGLQYYVRLQGAWMHHETYAAKGEFGSSHSPEVATCAAISPKRNTYMSVAQCKVNSGLLRCLCQSRYRKTETLNC